MKTGVCVSVWSLVRDHLSLVWRVTRSVVEKREQKGERSICLITAASMLVALEMIDIGLHTPEACVISTASFEVRVRTLESRDLRQGVSHNH